VCRYNRKAVCQLPRCNEEEYEEVKYGAGGCGCLNVGENLIAVQNFGFSPFWRQAWQTSKKWRSIYSRWNVVAFATQTQRPTFIKAERQDCLRTHGIKEPSLGTDQYTHFVRALKRCRADNVLKE
jgi:hypothetical protein